MPLNPVSIENLYALPSLNGGDLVTEEERRRIEAQGGGDVSPSTEIARLEMARSIAQNAQRPGADQGALSRALAAASIAVPMSEWKPAPVPLPVSKKDQVRTVLESRERQLRSLEQFASDPKNPVAQDEVERIREQIESEAQRALANSTLPSPVSMYETLVEDESPEVFRAKHKDMLRSLPGFNEEWLGMVSFDPETNEPKYPKWMEKPLEASMAKAMGVGDDKVVKEQTRAAADFLLEQLERQKPDPKLYGDDTAAFDEDMAAWENKRLAHFKRYNPEAAALLPTFAEEQGFTQPGTAPVTPPAAAPAAPSPVNEEEIGQLQMRFEANSIPTTVARSREELQSQITSGDVSPGDVVIVSTPSGAVAMKLESNGRFRQVGRFSSRQ